jgi:arginase family enzyme
VVDEALFGQSDRAVIDAAVAARRALVTLDLDFADPEGTVPGTGSVADK